MLAVSNHTQSQANHGFNLDTVWLSDKYLFTWLKSSSCLVQIFVNKRREWVCYLGLFFHHLAKANLTIKVTLTRMLNRKIPPVFFRWKWRLPFLFCWFLTSEECWKIKLNHDLGCYLLSFSCFNFHESMGLKTISVIKSDTCHWVTNLHWNWKF